MSTEVLINPDQQPLGEPKKRKNAIQFWIEDLQRYREIILFRTYASLKSESEKAYLGYVWWFIEPLVNTILFYTIFAIFLRQQSPGFAAFLVTGFVFWEWFNGSITFSMPSIGAKAPLLQLIYLPKFIFPMCSILSNAWKFICVMLVFMVYLWIIGYPPNVAYVALPLVLLIQLAIIIGIAFPVSIVYPLFPDAQIFIMTTLRGLMLVSGIFFAGSMLTGPAQFFFYLNPVAHLMEMYRAILLDGVFPATNSLLYTFVFALVSIIFAFWLMRRVDRVMPKLLTRE